MFERAWRIVATGFCFFVFGLGGVAVSLFVIPPMTLFVRDPLKRVRFSRFVVHHCFRFFIGLMNFVKVLTYELHGIGLHLLLYHPGQRLRLVATTTGEVEDTGISFGPQMRRDMAAQQGFELYHIFGNVCGRGHKEATRRAQD